MAPCSVKANGSVLEYFSFLGFFSMRCFEGLVFDSFPFAGVRPKLHGMRAVRVCVRVELCVRAWMRACVCVCAGVKV